MFLIIFKKTVDGEKSEKNVVFFNKAIDSLSTLVVINFGK